MTWERLDRHWALVEADLQDVGIDLGDLALMRSRSWRWLEVRVLGLLTRPPLFDAEGMPRFLTRIQQELFAPRVTAAARAESG